MLAKSRRTVSSWLRAAGVGDDWDRFYEHLVSIGKTISSLIMPLLWTILFRFAPGSPLDRPLRLCLSPFARSWYNLSMNPKLTPEQAAALRQQPGEPLPIIDPTTNEVCFIVTQNFTMRAKKAMEVQEALAELQESIAQVNEGNTIPHQQAVAQMRERLGFSTQS